MEYTLHNIPAKLALSAQKASSISNVPSDPFCPAQLQGSNEIWPPKSAHKDKIARTQQLGHCPILDSEWALKTKIRLKDLRFASGNALKYTLEEKSPTYLPKAQRESLRMHTHPLCNCLQAAIMYLNHMRSSDFRPRVKTQCAGCSNLVPHFDSPWYTLGICMECFQDFMQASFLLQTKIALDS